MDFAQRIAEIKERIDNLKTNKAIYESKKKELAETLKNEFGVSASLDEVEKLQKKLTAEVLELEKRAKNLLRSVEKKLEKYNHV